MNVQDKKVSFSLRARLLAAMVITLAVSPLRADQPELIQSSESELYETVVVESDSWIETPETTVEIVEADVQATDGEDESKVKFGDWLGYNAAQNDTTWLAGDDFGMFSIESYPTLQVGHDTALLGGTGFHFLDGPVTPDLRPRLFDFQLASHTRKAWSDRTMMDVKLGVGAFSDFEGSARKGVRFPGHAVWYRSHSDRYVSVLGAEFLDRDDISVLPVVGFVWQPHQEFILECIFPRPRIQVQLDQDHAMYLGGELGGGTWAVERDGNVNDNLTYRDLRLTWGVIDFGSKRSSVLEIGWAFDRSLEYRSGVGDQNLDGALILRCHAHF